MQVGHARGVSTCTYPYLVFVGKPRPSHTVRARGGAQCNLGYLDTGMVDYCGDSDTGTKSAAVGGTGTRLWRVRRYLPSFSCYK